MKKIIIILFLLTFSIHAQNFSIGLYYSRVLIAKNYESSTAYSLEGDYGILKDFLKVGITASIIDAKIQNTFIKNPPPGNPYEISYKLGVQIKCYPLDYLKNLGDFKPYIGIEVGDYISSYVSTYLNMPSSCEIVYRLDLPNTIYSNINLGTDIFLDETLGLNLGCRYQIFNPTIKYKKPDCSEGYVTDYSKYTEKVNLNTFLWSLGVRINF